MAGKPLWMEGSRNVLKEICLQESCIEKPYFIGNDFWKFLSFKIRECQYAPKQKIETSFSFLHSLERDLPSQCHSFKTREKKKSTSSHSTSSAVRLLIKRYETLWYSFFHPLMGNQPIPSIFGFFMARKGNCPVFCTCFTSTTPTFQACFADKQRCDAISFLARKTLRP